VTLQSVQVQVVRWSIRREEYDHTVFVEGVEDAFQDHRISNVKDLELVDEEKGKALAELVSDNLHSLSSASLQLFVHFVFHLVDLKHELIVVELLLLVADVQAVVKEVHHMTLATARISVEIEAFQVIQVFELLLDLLLHLFMRVQFSFAV